MHLVNLDIFESALQSGKSVTNLITCGLGKFLNWERKSCGFKNIWIHLDGALKSQYWFWFHLLIWWQTGIIFESLCVVWPCKTNDINVYNFHVVCQVYLILKISFLLADWSNLVSQRPLVGVTVVKYLVLLVLVSSL